MENFVQEIVRRFLQKNGQRFEGQLRQLANVEMILRLLELIGLFVEDRFFLSEHQPNDVTRQRTVFQHRSRA